MIIVFICIFSQSIAFIRFRIVFVFLGMTEDNENMEIVKTKIMENKELFTNLIESLEYSRLHSSSFDEQLPSIPSLQDQTRPENPTNQQVQPQPIDLQSQPEITLKKEYVFASEAKPDLTIANQIDHRPSTAIPEKKKANDLSDNIMFEYHEEESDKEPEKDNAMPPSRAGWIKQQEESQIHGPVTNMEYVEPQPPKKAVKKSGKKETKKPNIGKTSTLQNNKSGLPQRRQTRAQQKGVPNVAYSSNSRKKSSNNKTSSQKPVKVLNKKERKAEKKLEKVDSKAKAPIRPKTIALGFEIYIVQDSSIGELLKRRQSKSANSMKSEVKVVKNGVKPHLNGSFESTMKPVNVQVVVSLLPENPQTHLSKQKKKKKEEKIHEDNRFQAIVADRERQGLSAKINLGSCSILEIVEHLNRQGIISGQLYTQFAENHTIHDILDFLTKFTKGKLSSFDFRSIPFTLLDHRRLAELATKLFPEKYEIKEVMSLNKDVHSFLQSLYQLDAKKYFELYKTIDSESRISWWKEIINNNKDKINRAVSLGRNKTTEPRTNIPPASSPRLLRKIRA